MKVDKREMAFKYQPTNLEELDELFDKVVSREVFLSEIDFSIIGEQYVYSPQNKEELEELIEYCIEGKVFLSEIETSAITDMSYLFSKNRKIDWNDPRNSISDWDVSKVTDMSNMFCCSRFNGDISEWDVSSVKTMECMFEESRFAQNIFSWALKINKECCMDFFNRNSSHENKFGLFENVQIFTLAAIDSGVLNEKYEQGNDKEKYEVMKFIRHNGCINKILSLVSTILSENKR